MVCGGAWIRYAKTDTEIGSAGDGRRHRAESPPRSTSRGSPDHRVCSFQCSLHKFTLMLRQHCCDPWHWRPSGRYLVQECRHSGERAVGQLARQGRHATSSSTTCTYNEIWIPVSVVWTRSTAAECFECGTSIAVGLETKKRGVTLSPRKSLIMANLCAYAKGFQWRPLVFIAHCFGGLVVLKVSRRVKPELADD